ACVAPHQHPPSFPTLLSSDLSTAAWPPIPASTSSKIRVGTVRSPASTTSSASMIRANSPPLAPLSSERRLPGVLAAKPNNTSSRSEEHTSELQSRFELVCRLQ